MGSKIYDGFRFRTASLSRIHAAVASFREALRPVLLREIAQYLAEEAVERLDRQAAGLPVEDPERPALAYVWRRLREARADIERGHRHPREDFSASLSILPMGRQVLGLLYTERPEIRRLWLEQPDVEEYAYWSSGGVPSHLSARSWDARKRAWLRAVPPGKTPSMVGFSADCTDPRLPEPTPDAVLAALPPLAERAARQARSLLVAEFMKRHPPSASERRDSMVDWMASYRLACEHLETEEGRLSLVDLADSLTPRLIHPVTIEALRGF